MKNRSPKRFVEIAVALAYNEEENTAPVVVGVGGGEAARALRRSAERYGIPTTENESLAQSLAALPEYSQIPESQYGAVADLLTEIENDLLLDRLKRS